MTIPGAGGSNTGAYSSDFKVGYIEVLHPGVAYTWTDDATGLKIKTNLKAKDCNRRPGDEGIVYFKSDRALWSWALRVMSAQKRGVV